MRHTDSCNSDEVLEDVSRTGSVFGNSAELLQKVLDTIPQRVFWKDREMSYLGCNQLFADDAGLESPMTSLG